MAASATGGRRVIRWRQDRENSWTWGLRTRGLRPWTRAKRVDQRSDVRSLRSEVRYLPMNGRIFFWSLTSALAGFLFGFDTVVISGAEKTIQALWGLSPGLHGIAKIGRA